MTQEQGSRAFGAGSPAHVWQRQAKGRVLPILLNLLELGIAKLNCQEAVSAD